MHYKYVCHDVKNEHAVAIYEDSPNNVKWTKCKHPKWGVVLVALDAVNIPCLMHNASRPLLRCRPRAQTSW